MSDDSPIDAEYCANILSRDFTRLEGLCNVQKIYRQEITKPIPRTQREFSEHYIGDDVVAWVKENNVIAIELIPKIKDSEYGYVVKYLKTDAG